MSLIYWNVNEEGEPYARHSRWEDAVLVLMQYPNDYIVICTEGSPMADKLRREPLSRDDSLAVQTAGRLMPVPRYDAMETSRWETEGDPTKP